MKFRIIIALTMLMALGSVSCKKGLDEVPFSSLSPDNVFTDEEGLKKVTYGVYQSWVAMDFYGVYYRFVLAESGHRYATAGIFGAAFIDPYYKFGHRPTDGVAATVWSRAFMTISRANSVIDNATKAVDEAVANTYIAEARFLRAYAYFNLVRDFGGVPLIKNEITSLAQSDLIYAPKSSIEETYNFIVEDIKFAEANLPDKWAGVDVGRITAGTAKAMLGKVYLHMAGKPLNKTEYYQMAADKLQEVVGPANEAKYGYGLMDNFSDIFSLTNERNKEILLSFGYFISSANSNASIYPFFLFPRGIVNGDEQTNYGLTYNFYQLFEPADTRRDFTVADRYAFVGTPTDGAEAGDSIIYNPTERHYINKRTGAVFGNSTVRTGLAYAKFARAPRPAGSVPWGYSTDMIELRFADVLLCLAEALTEAGQPGEALQHLNRVRQRAHATPSGASGQEDMRTAIRQERRLELTGEFTTVYDIRRWGTLQQEIAAMSPDQILNGDLNPYSPKLELYPIPQSQIDANPNLQQNDEWK
ncbi:MAG: RagB/SusD family nutrient uptake outer membrane protein [Agriterribacter sp.]